MGKRRSQQGYTLVELMITLAVAGVMIAASAPLVTDILRTNRLTALSNQLIGTLGYARSEAIKRSSRVTMCRSSSGSTCDGTQWENGWLIFVDSDKNSAYTAGETILRVREALPTNFTMRGGSTTTSTITFLSSGAVSTSANGVFALCYNSSTSNMQGVVVNKMGRIRAAQDSNSDGLPENESGTNLSCNPT
ncbi:MAG: prepilin-type N-terminal cleavage/methylation domain-containing protein [Magnetococcales bacterium]|nr:GspH/FimT family pseudopilin [Magnetococcales bacterium]NGZ25481.1 prepilin-type N-terminal cleavage/methylation domain-containing protein [Magnetococcales bacterium]